MDQKHQSLSDYMTICSFFCCVNKKSELDSAKTPRQTQGCLPENCRLVHNHFPILIFFFCCVNKKNWCGSRHLLADR